jgi:hypothetical protein
VLALIGAKKMFSFSFLLILDEGGFWEGWVKSAYSLLATTAWPRNHNNIFLRQAGGKKRRPIRRREKRRQICGESAAKRRPLCCRASFDWSKNV